MSEALAPLLEGFPHYKILIAAIFGLTGLAGFFAYGLWEWNWLQSVFRGRAVNPRWMGIAFMLFALDWIIPWRWLDTILFLGIIFFVYMAVRNKPENKSKVDESYIDRMNQNR